MCECPSTNPGISVAPERSMTLAPAVSMEAAGPADSMRPPRTRTAQASWEVSPSKTRAGLSTVASCAAAERASRKRARERIGELYVHWHGDGDCEGRLVGSVPGLHGGADADAASGGSVLEGINATSLTRGALALHQALRSEERRVGEE